MESVRRNGDDVGPARDVALAIVVISHRHYGAVALKADGVVVARRESDDVRPARNVALAVQVVSHRHYGAVALKADGVVDASREGLGNPRQRHAPRDAHSRKTAPRRRLPRGGRVRLEVRPAVPGHARGARGGRGWGVQLERPSRNEEREQQRNGAPAPSGNRAPEPSVIHRKPPRQLRGAARAPTPTPRAPPAAVTLEAYHAGAGRAPGRPLACRRSPFALIRRYLGHHGALDGRLERRPQPPGKPQQRHAFGQHHPCEDQRRPECAG